MEKRIKELEAQIREQGREIQELRSQAKHTSPFKRVRHGDIFYSIGFDGVNPEIEIYSRRDNALYDEGNYCTNERIIEQRRLEEILSRRLWRFSLENGYEKIDWNIFTLPKYSIGYDLRECFLTPIPSGCLKFPGAVHFIDNETAERAIEGIVKPFLNTHPGFEVGNYYV